MQYVRTYVGLSDEIMKIPGDWFVIFERSRECAQQQVSEKHEDETTPRH